MRGLWLQQSEVLEKEFLLVDAKIRASDIDLPEPIILVSRWTIRGNTVVRKNAKSKYIKGK